MRSVSDLDDTIEDIDVREHCAVLGGRRPGWFEAHVLHLYSHDFASPSLEPILCGSRPLGKKLCNLVGVVANLDCTSTGSLWVAGVMGMVLTPQTCILLPSNNIDISPAVVQSMSSMVRTSFTFDQGLIGMAGTK